MMTRRELQLTVDTLELNLKLLKDAISEDTDRGYIENLGKHKTYIKNLKVFAQILNKKMSTIDGIWSEYHELFQIEENSKVEK